MRRATACAAVALLATAVLISLAPSRSAAAVLISTRVYPHERGRAIPHSFLGFSVEWNRTPFITGLPSVGPDPVYRGLLANLAAFGGGVPTLRVGGNSEDGAWWNPSGSPPPNKRGLYVNIRPANLIGLAENSRATGQRLTLGVNLASDDPLLAANEARAFAQYIPRRYVSGLEIGNEPDSFQLRVKYDETDASGRVIRRHYSRPKSYNGRQYLREWERIGRAVLRAEPGFRLVGTAGYGSIVPPRTFIARERRHLAFYSEHAYPLTGCAPHGKSYEPGDKHYPTLARLLAPGALKTTIAQERPGIAAAHRAHKRFVVGETGSVACTSRPQVSASFGTALWGLDYLFLQAGLGVDGVDFHVSHPDKSPFRVYYSGKAGFVGFADPLYYGMLAFAHAAGRHGRLLLAPTLVARPGDRGRANARVWVVRDGRQLRAIVVNKDIRRSGTVRIAVPGAHARAELARLSAPSIGARTGITFGGQSVASPTADGTLQGPFVQTPVRPRRGVYSFHMPKASAALLTIG